MIASRAKSPILLSRIAIAALGLALCLCSGCTDTIPQPTPETSATTTSPNPSPTYKLPTQSTQEILDELAENIERAGGTPVGRYQLQQTASLEMYIPDVATNVGIRLKCASPGLRWEITFDGDDGRLAQSTCADDSDVDVSFPVIPSDKGKTTMIVTVTNSTRNDQAIFIVTYWKKQ